MKSNAKKLFIVGIILLTLSVGEVRAASCEAQLSHLRISDVKVLLQFGDNLVKEGRLYVATLSANNSRKIAFCLDAGIGVGTTYQNSTARRVRGTDTMKKAFAFMEGYTALDNEASEDRYITAQTMIWLEQAGISIDGSNRTQLYVSVWKMLASARGIDNIDYTYSNNLVDQFLNTPKPNITINTFTSKSNSYGHQRFISALDIPFCGNNPNNPNDPGSQDPDRTYCPSPNENIDITDCVNSTGNLQQCIQQNCPSSNVCPNGYAMKSVASPAACANDNQIHTGAFWQELDTSTCGTAQAEGELVTPVGDYCAMYCTESVIQYYPGGISSPISVGTNIVWPTSTATENTVWKNLYSLKYQGTKACTVRLKPGVDPVSDLRGLTNELNKINRETRNEYEATRLAMGSGEGVCISKYGEGLKEAKEEYSKVNKDLLEIENDKKIKDDYASRKNATLNDTINALNEVTNKYNACMNDLNELNNDYVGANSTLKSYKDLLETHKFNCLDKNGDLKPDRSTCKVFSFMPNAYGRCLKNTVDRIDCEKKIKADEEKISNQLLRVNKLKNQVYNKRAECQGYETAKNEREKEKSKAQKEADVANKVASEVGQKYSTLKNELDKISDKINKIQTKVNECQNYMTTYNKAVGVLKGINTCGGYSITGDNYQFESNTSISYDDPEYGAAYQLQPSSVISTCTDCESTIDTQDFSTAPGSIVPSQMEAKANELLNKVQNRHPTITKTVTYQLPDSGYRYINKKTNQPLKSPVGDYINVGYSFLPTSYTKYTDYNKQYHLNIHVHSLGENGKFTALANQNPYICNYSVTNIATDECVCPDGTTYAGKDLYPILYSASSVGKPMTCADAQLKYCGTPDVTEQYFCPSDENINITDCLNNGEGFNTCVAKLCPNGSGDKFCPNDPSIKITACLNVGTSYQECVNRLCNNQGTPDEDYHCPKGTFNDGMDIKPCAFTMMAKGYTLADALQYCKDTVCPGGRRIIYRVIDLSNPFPGKTAGYGKTETTLNFNLDNENGRFPGNNWRSVDLVKIQILNNRTVEADKVYEEKPLYSFILDRNTIEEIRKYNDQQEKVGGLADFTLDCKNGTACISSFIRDAKYGLIDGVCKSSNRSQFYTCAESRG